MKYNATTEYEDIEKEKQVPIIIQFITTIKLFWSGLLKTFYAAKFHQKKCERKTNSAAESEY